MKTQLLSSMGSFVLGGSVALVGLLSWTGTADLGTIKESVQSYVEQSEQHSSALLEEYNVTVESANAEIGEYQKALGQANDNIDKLITGLLAKERELEQAELEHQQELSDLQKEHQTELENANQQAQDDLAELQTELDNLYARMDSQYETDMNDIIAQANEQINMANEEVAQTKDDVNDIIEGSQMSDIVNGEKLELDTTGDKTVNDITGIVD